MPSVNISDDTYRRITHFKKVIDAVMGEELESIDDYAEMILGIGMRKMLADVLPDDEILRDTLLAMFQDNPEYLCGFIARVLKEGEKKNIRKSKEEWMIEYR